ncbi:MAG: PaaI family thioesterase [Myxococcota bacterium]
MTINPEYVDAVRELVRTAPFPHHMSMTLEEMTPGGCVVELAVSKKHLQPFQIVHGGVLATLIDTATFWAVFLSLPSQNDGLVNVDLKLNYLAPVTGGVLRATGTEIRMGKRIGYSEAHVRAEDGTLVAHGTSTLAVLPGKGLAIESARELA